MGSEERRRCPPCLPPPPLLQFFYPPLPLIDNAFNAITERKKIKRSVPPRRFFFLFFFFYIREKKKLFFFLFHTQYQNQNTNTSNATPAFPLAAVYLEQSTARCAQFTPPPTTREFARDRPFFLVFFFFFAPDPCRAVMSVCFFFPLRYKRTPTTSRFSPAAAAALNTTPPTTCVLVPSHSHLPFIVSFSTTAKKRGKQF